MGAAGGAMIFFMLLAGAVVVGLYVFAYAAHVLLVVIEGTSTGFDDVSWPDEPYVDWLWKGVYLGWLIAVWLVPLLFIGRWLAKTQTASAAAADFVYLAAGLAWLFFPISLLSSMSASSRWFVFSPSLIPRLIQRTGSVILFYAITGPLLAGMAFVVAWAARSDQMLLIPVAAFAAAAGLLIYARLFGRLALMVRFTTDRPAPVQPAPRRRPRVRAQAAAYDPWGPLGSIVQPRDLPPTDAPDPEARTGYDVRLDNHHPPAPDVARHRVDPADIPASYDIADGPATTDPPRGPMPDRIVKPSEYELELARSGKSPELPESPWFDRTMSFPFYRANRSALIALTGGLSVFGLFVKLMLTFVPA